ncbi:hypothetical protein C500_11815 [Natrialba magadii ATCC 43099]|uniref:Uncharacterized protein n=1 Tax=Natrialba magadii (strain ATCC 43099 / DSM 3394 / CCM 3739 / CIP 104546 / IAM 13178 / JCM 8861 / NBRC 102185 / NCIMB 2190 / MS3) TaxID=547559 RepID=L9UWD2_NATMM|nr:hypothetical protein C500_11815 [Natrialba magadii ATCC 43099]
MVKWWFESVGGTSDGVDSGEGEREKPVDQSMTALSSEGSLSFLVDTDREKTIAESEEIVAHSRTTTADRPR